MSFINQIDEKEIISSSKSICILYPSQMPISQKKNAHQNLCDKLMQEILIRFVKETYKD
jgi:hypothetical protein